MDYDSWLEQPYVEAGEADDEMERFQEYLEETYEEVDEPYEGEFELGLFQDDNGAYFTVDPSEVSFESGEDGGWNYKRNFKEYEELFPNRFCSNGGAGPFDVDLDEDADGDRLCNDCKLNDLEEEDF